MTATFTQRLGLILQAYASNPETWGTELNGAMIELNDDVHAVEEITVDGNVTLTWEDGTQNQARRAFLPLKGAGGFTVTVKAVDRAYLVHNRCAADVTIEPENGTGAVVRAGTLSVWYTDGATAQVADVTLDRIAKPEADVDLNGQKIVNLAKGSNPTDAATLANEIQHFAKPTGDLDLNSRKLMNVSDGDLGSQDAATVKQVEGLISSATVNMPAQTGHGGAVLSTDGSTPHWLAFATGAEIREATESKPLSASNIWDGAEPPQLGNWSGTVTIDFSEMLGMASAIATGNVTLGGVSNAKPGQTVVLDVSQDIVGGRTLSHNTSYWVTAKGEAIEWDTTAGARNILVAVVLPDGKVMLSLAGKAVE